jgi:hypothetical protein
MCDTRHAGNELLRRLRHPSRQSKLTFPYEGRPSKGGHGRIYMGHNIPGPKVTRISHAFLRSWVTFEPHDLLLRDYVEIFAVDTSTASFNGNEFSATAVVNVKSLFTVDPLASDPAAADTDSHGPMDHPKKKLTDEWLKCR